MEGAMRKWVLGDASLLSKLAYISKDGVFALCLLQLSSGMKVQSLQLRKGLEIGLFLLLVGACVSCFGGINLIGAVLSTRTFFVLPVAALVASQTLTRESIYRVANVVAILAIGNAVLAGVQFYSPRTAWINKYSTDEAFVATVGFAENVRATGTFSYITGFGYFGFVAVWAAIIILIRAKQPHQMVWGLVALTAGLTCSFVTASRAVGLMVVATVVAWVVFGSGIGQKVKIGIIGLILVGFLFITDSGNELFEMGSAVQRRAAVASDDFWFRMEYQFVTPFVRAFDLAPNGWGYGTEQTGGGGMRAGDRHQFTIESPWGRMILEVGFVGMIGFVICCVTVLGICYQRFRFDFDPDVRTVYLISGISLLLNFLLGFQFNHVAGFFFWLVTALVIAYDNQSIYLQPNTKGR